VPVVYMPLLPASTEDRAGNAPLAPESTITLFTGALHKGCERVDVREGVAVGVCDRLEVEVKERERVGDEADDEEDVALVEAVEEALGEPVRVAELLGVPVKEPVGVALEVRVEEQLGVSERVAELLGVPVHDIVDVELDERVGEALPVSERVAELLGVPVRVEDGLDVPERVDDELGVPVPLAVVDALRVFDGEPEVERV